MEIKELKERVLIDRVIEDLGGRIYTPGSYGYRYDRWMAVVCPFHDDRSPSASINVARGRFNCHGCNVYGDIIDIAKRVLNTADTREAMTWLKDHYIT